MGTVTLSLPPYIVKLNQLFSVKLHHVFSVIHKDIIPEMVVKAYYNVLAKLYMIGHNAFLKLDSFYGTDNTCLSKILQADDLRRKNRCPKN